MISRANRQARPTGRRGSPQGRAGDIGGGQCQAVDGDPGEEDAAGKQREQHGPPQKAIQRLDNHRDEQPGDDKAGKIGRRRNRLFQQAADGADVFVPVDHRNIRVEPVAKEGGEQQGRVRMVIQFADQRPPRAGAEQGSDQGAEGRTDGVGIYVAHRGDPVRVVKLSGFHTGGQQGAGQDCQGDAQDRRDVWRHGAGGKETERHVQQDIGQQVTAVVPVPPGAQQGTERIAGDGGRVKYERVERAVNDEDRYNPQQPRQPMAGGV